MFITISEFADSRKVDRDTINAWIRKHPEVGDSCKMQGKDKVIDITSDAYKILEKKYPLPQLVQIVEDTESRKKLIKAQELIIQMQGKMAELQEKVSEQSMIIATAEATKVLLEDKEKQLKDKEEALFREIERADREQVEAERLRKELELEKNKTWWDKLRGK